MGSKLRFDQPGWTLLVDPVSAGLRLDRFIAARIPRLSRARAARLEVRDLDSDRILKKSQTVREGQRLFVARPVPDADLPVPEPRVLFEDDELIVLNKPAGLATHPTASRWRSTVTTWLRGRAEPGHRLDIETSGVLLCTKQRAVDVALKADFAAGAVHKTYWAVVSGTPEWRQQVSEQPLGFDATSAVRLKMGPGELPAQTRFRVLRRSGGRALVEASPRSGRQHQIRVHLALLGHPIVGDKLYGPDEALFLRNLEAPLGPEDLRTLGHPRQALHALRLEWRGERFEAPWPAELDGLLES